MNPINRLPLEQLKQVILKVVFTKKNWPVALLGWCFSIF
jgi:hypothetical protein